MSNDIPLSQIVTEVKSLSLWQDHIRKVGHSRRISSDSAYEKVKELISSIGPPQISSDQINMIHINPLMHTQPGNKQHYPRMIIHEHSPVHCVSHLYYLEFSLNIGEPPNVPAIISSFRFCEIWVSTFHFCLQTYLGYWLASHMFFNLTNNSKLCRKCKISRQLRA